MGLFLVHFYLCHKVLRWLHTLNWNSIEPLTSLKGMKATVQGLKREGWTHLCTNAPSHQDNQCGTEHEGDGWELACQRQTSVGVNAGHPFLKNMNMSPVAVNNHAHCPPTSSPACISHAHLSFYLTHLPLQRSHNYYSFTILLNAVSHPADHETKGVKWLNPCFLLEICKWDILTTKIIIVHKLHSSYTPMSVQKQATSYTSISANENMIICNILSLHNLSGVMDDEDDRHLLDILG